MTVFNKDVLFMCHFEKAMIKAIQQHYPSVHVKCCFFHYTQSLRKKAKEVIKSTTTSGGENAENARKSMKAVRRMMPPLVPEELVTPQLVELIIAASFNGYTEIPLDVKAFGNYVLRIYVGKHHPRSSASAGPRYPLALWNVSGMASRTNNAAESVHAQMNPDVNGKVSVFEFLSTIEKQMAKTNDRVATGCKWETKTVERVKNGLLAHELHQLLNGEQGVVNFLDNCGSIVKMKSVTESTVFVPQTISSAEDTKWISDNREQVVAAAKDLYRRLRSGRPMVDDDVLENVSSWSFQDPEDPVVHVAAIETEFSLVNDHLRNFFE